MNVDFLPLKRINNHYKDELLTQLNNVLDSGYFIQGEQTTLFEGEFADYCQAKYCVGVATGLDALTLTFRAWKELGRIDEGDEVIVPANTYIATILSILENNLKPVFVEPNISTFNFELSEIEQNITKRTRAILPVHLYGRAINMPQLLELTQQYNLLTLSDCAQAHGARINNKGLGSYGNACAFSFYPGKNLGALGDGGAITSNDKGLIDCIRIIANYGSNRKYHNQYLGTNSRLDELQAAFLRKKLLHLDKENQQRREVAKIYSSQISNPKISAAEYPGDESSHVWHLYTVLSTSNKMRDKLQQHLKEQNVQTLIHYPVAPHKQQALSEFKHLSFPITEQIHDCILSLPCHPYMTKQEIKQVINACNTF